MKLLLVLGLCLAATLARKSYHNYKVYEVTVDSKSVLEELRSWCENNQVDVWKEARYIGDTANLMIPPQQLSMFINMAMKSHLSYSILIKDVEKQITENFDRMESRRGPDGRMAFDINEYNTYEDIRDQLTVWQGSCPDGLTCTIETLGDSYEGNPIESFTISSGSGKQAVWIDSLIHCREWTAGSTNLYFIDNIINNYGSDNTVTNLVDTYDWIFVPVMNPDGYLYTMADNGEALWRKNREPNQGSACVGTDLNRNYDTGYWGWSGTSTNPCSDTYGGPSAGSAIETQILQDTLVGRDIFAFVSIHGVAAMWLHSWGQSTVPGGGTCDIADDDDDLQQVGDATIAAIEATEDRPNNDRWVAGSVCTTIYPASGGTVDYAYSIGHKYSYTPEVSGSSFQPNPNVIEPTFRETWNGIVAMIGEIETIETAKKQKNY